MSEYERDLRNGAAGDEPDEGMDLNDGGEDEETAYKPQKNFQPENVYAWQKGDLLVRIEMSKSVCFAMQQNARSILKSLSILNNTDTEMKNVSLKVGSDPEFFEPLFVSVPALQPGEEHPFRAAEIIPDYDYLASVTERIKASVTAEVEIGEKPLKTDRIAIDILSFDEWPGMGTSPEILACFSTPRDPAVNGIISEAAQILKGEGLSFNGYQQGDPNIVNRQLAAIFSVIKSRNIAYSMPPASFEQSGQKIRLPQTIVDLGLGTCLDTTMLLCACAEAVGINPVIYIFQGHAFPGFWLKETCFAEVINDDLSAINKRMAGGLSELTSLESTMLTDQKSSYTDAQKIARDRLNDGKGFVCYIDIARARKTGILPLPIRYEDNGRYFVDRQMYDPQKEEVKEMRVVSGELNQNALNDRLEKWQRDLLDITLRNPLVNYKINKSGVPLLNFDLEAVEDAFAEGKQFQLMPHPAELGRQITDITKLSVENDDRLTAILKNDFNAGGLRSALKDDDLIKRLTSMYRSEQAAVEETGANTLYLALGFLKWQEKDKPAVDRFAPILLLPVGLSRTSAQTGYRIVLREDENQANLSLIEMLRVNFKIDASGLLDLPHGEIGIDIRQVLTYIRKLVIEQKGWDVIEAASLGSFQFAKFVLWNDLVTREDQIRRHPLTGALIAAKNTQALYEPAFEPNGRLYLPLDCDSSQTEAVKTAGEGKTFVLHGPPGSGKSQVITNIIANALANGKRVLFIAEKIAALDVVKRRLDKLGLFDFCLELHSNKSQKRGFFEQFDKLLELAESAKDVNYDEAAAKLEAAAEELGAVQNALHQTKKIGKSVFSGLNELFRLSGDDFQGDDFLPVAFTDITGKEYEAGLDTLRSLLDIGAVLGEPVNSAFYGCGVKDYSFDLRDKVVRLTKTLSESFSGFTAALEGLTAALGIIKIRRKEINYFEYRHTLDLYITLGEILHYKRKNGLIKFLLGMFSKRYKTMKRSGFYKKLKRFVKEKPDDAALIFAALNIFMTAEKELNEALQYGGKFTESENWPAEVFGAAATFFNHVATLRDACIYNGYLAKCRDFGQLTETVAKYHAGELRSEEVLSLYEPSFWNGWVRREISSDPILNGFSPNEYATKRERYKALVEFTAKLTQKEIFLKLAARLPNFKFAAQSSSEPGILLKAVKSRGRGMTIRQIFKRVPELLATIKPCMLMSPLSAAQYLPEDFPAFDMVVFDEASQLQTAEAAGAIARGKSTVVVGDPNQLPPTTFFASKADDEETDFEMQDLESVLDDMLTLSAHERRLLWHYRSEHESLIAYPNVNYYDSKLITFPTPDDAHSRVEFRKVDGVYDRGGTRTNQKEAEAVVEELFECLKDPVKCKDTYGIVTFNTTQQSLIQDMIDKRLIKEPTLDKYFSSGDAPVFVKNIESVQGDERDVIIFSVTYGLDKEGKMTVNFGPINKDGGWRRLNVAITRACKRILLFSTITPDMIDLSRTSAKGVAGLRGFMSYAINPRSYLAGGLRSGGESALVASVAAALKKAGYRVVENMGRSVNKIDLAVQTDDGKFVLGILCDNESLGKGSVRDREYGNEGFLRRAGWNITRVYAIEWWQDSVGETKRLISILEGGEDPLLGNVSAEALAELESQHQEIAFNPNIPLPVREYIETDLPQNLPDNFYLYNNVQTVTEQIKTVIRTEGPIPEAKLFKTIMAAWNIPRSSQKFTEHMAAVLKRVNPIVNQTQATKFYWNQKEDMAMTHFRAPSDRKGEDICKEEFAVAVHFIMKNANSIEHEDLVRETAKLFNFIKSPVVSMRIDFALSLLVVEGKIRKEGSKYRFVK